jgi:hypothetical protein
MWHPSHPAPEQCEGCTWGRHAGPRAVLSSLSRCHLCRVLPRAVRRERPLSRFYGLGDALVLGPRLARVPLDWTPTRQDGYSVLPPTRIQGLRDLLDHCARCRGDG